MVNGLCKVGLRWSSAGTSPQHCLQLALSYAIDGVIEGGEHFRGMGGRSRIHQVSEGYDVGPSIAVW